jgi:hypothetical protein
MWSPCGVCTESVWTLLRLEACIRVQGICTESVQSPQSPHGHMGECKVLD